MKFHSAVLKFLHVTDMVKLTGAFLQPFTAKAPNMHCLAATVVYQFWKLSNGISYKYPTIYDISD
jgi:hypothetical protein